MLRFIVNYGNLKWFTGNRKWPRYVYTIYLNLICIGPLKKCLLGFCVCFADTHMQVVYTIVHFMICILVMDPTTATVVQPHESY